MGRNLELTEDQALAILKTGARPVWLAKDLAAHAGVSRPTAKDRLESLATKEEVETINVGNATLYYVVGIETRPVGDGDEPVKRDLRRTFEDQFVGLETHPWTAVLPADGPAVAGDKIQIEVEGRPGDWHRHRRRVFEDRRKKLYSEELTADRVQALLSGELYERPTVPIEHASYPEEYDLESNIGVEIVETDHGAAVVAGGMKNYLIRPCNNAVHLRNVEVDWISPLGDGMEVEYSDSVMIDPTHWDKNSHDRNRPPEIQAAIDQLQDTMGE